MHLKLFISIGTIAMGLIGVAGQAQATESPQDMMSSQPLEIARAVVVAAAWGAGPAVAAWVAGMPVAWQAATPAAVA